MRATLTRDAANPWLGLFCEPWILAQSILALAILLVIERAFRYMIAQVHASGGFRPDLAQVALVAEMGGFLLLIPLLPDPLMSFHWGLSPFGMGA